MAEVGKVGDSSPVTGPNSTDNNDNPDTNKKVLMGAAQSVGDAGGSGNWLWDLLQASNNMQDEMSSSYISDSDTANNLLSLSTDINTAGKAKLQADLAAEQGLTGDALTKAQGQFNVDNTAFQSEQSVAQNWTSTAQNTATQMMQNSQQNLSTFANIMNGVMNAISQNLAK